MKDFPECCNLNDIVALLASLCSCIILANCLTADDKISVTVSNFTAVKQLVLADFSLQLPSGARLDSLLHKFHDSIKKYSWNTFVFLSLLFGKRI